MNEVGRILGIPLGGWGHGQAHLFEHGDVRLVWLLRRFAVRTMAERIARNLDRVNQLSGADIMLTVVTSARENSSALADVSMRMIDTWHEGGLDFLWADRKKLGLPRSVIDAWRERRRMVSHETQHWVSPAFIPARDQILAYAAQIRSSYDHHFRKHLAGIMGAQGDAAVAGASRGSMLVWKAYSFLAPGGAAYVPTKTVAAQNGQSFGCRSALLFLAHDAAKRGIGRLDLGAILTNPELNDVEWVRSSKVRVAEALFLERLLTVTRELLSPSSLDE